MILVLSKMKFPYLISKAVNTRFFHLKFMWATLLKYISITLVVVLPLKS